MAHIRITDIDNASQLMAEYDQHVLKISSKAHALRKWSKTDNEFTLPTSDVLIRYETDLHHLYIDSEFFKRYDASALSEKLRRNTQYCGAKAKRLLKGLDASTLEKHGLESKVSHALFFDLKKINANRVEARRARGRPADHKEKADNILRKAETDFDGVYKALNHAKRKQQELNREASEPHARNRKIPFEEYYALRKKELMGLIIYLEMAYNLSVETNNFIQAYDKPLRMKSKRLTRNNPYAPKDAQRTRILAFEKMIEIEAKFIHRERYYWSDKTGFLKEHLKAYVPEDIDPTLFSGYYKEWSHSDNTGVQKWLWIPVALLNTYTHKDSTILTPEEKEELKFYRTDVRYVSTEVKRIGGKAQRCAKFDMRRTVNPARDEPQREPEKNKHKD